MYKLIYLARRAAAVDRADWPRTWRSHAVFASQFPALEAGIAWMRYCNRIDAPMLDGRPCALGVASTAHDGVAIAGSNELAALDGAGFSEADRARIDADELRVFDMPTPAFTYYCSETVLRDGRPGEAAVFRFLARADGATREDFDERFGGSHADLARTALPGLPGLTRYVHNRPLHAPLERFPFDGIVESWFAQPGDAVRALAGHAHAPIAADLATFCDPGRSVTLLTAVCHRWPKD